ncbi:hypothetical protein L7F22_063103, partial [Adiantum nelumboides]|nr:hypothetical protein [Adiantum nelumboides]
ATMARTKQTARIEYQMGPDGQRLKAPATKARTSQVEGEVHTEEAGASNQHGQSSTVAKERRKHHLVVYSSDSDDSDGNTTDESDQDKETSTQKQPSEGSKETQTDEDFPWVGAHIQTYEAHLSLLGPTGSRVRKRGCEDQGGDEEDEGRWQEKDGGLPNQRRRERGSSDEVEGEARPA